MAAPENPGTAKLPDRRGTPLAQAVIPPEAGPSPASRAYRGVGGGELMTTELADNVRKYRRRAGLSQEELATPQAYHRAPYARSNNVAPSAWRPCTLWLAHWA